MKESEIVTVLAAAMAQADRDRTALSRKLHIQPSHYINEAQTAASFFWPLIESLDSLSDEHNVSRDDCDCDLCQALSRIEESINDCNR